MSTTTRNGIGFPLSSNLYARTSEVMSLLANGWVEVTYRKGDGKMVTRLATRNPTLVGAFGNHSDAEAIRKSDKDFDATPLVYFDYSAGGIRSFCVEDLRKVVFPSDAPENNH